VIGVTDGADSLAEILDDREQLVNMADFYKTLRRELEDVSSVRDLVPLSPQNDPVYLQPANIEKAEWFAELWREEGRPEFHARGFFYELLGQGYERPNGKPVENSAGAWTAVQKGAKWARVLGLIPAEKVTDEKNPDPDVTVTPETTTPLDEQRSRSWRRLWPDAPVGYDAPKIPSGFNWRLAELEHETAEEVLDHVAERLANELFRGVEYRAALQQPYYIEVWAEKGGLLPEDLLREYNATIRPAGGGEVSLSMCSDAVRRAARREQNLVIIHVTDYDPKGADMPKSAARKVELEAAAAGVDAHLHHAALTGEQVERYGLPGEPGKTPQGNGSGAKAYNAHKELFREAEGGYPVEVNAFAGREPEEFRRELERYLEPYHDDTLARRLEDAVEEAKEHVREAYTRQADAEVVADRLATAEAAVEEYRERMRDPFENLEDTLAELREEHENARDATGVQSAVDGLRDSVAVSPEDVVDAVLSEWSPPEGEADTPPAPPLLDTRRSIGKQIDHYHAADIRYDAGGEGGLGGERS
jgi:hypothetical protein